MSILDEGDNWISIEAVERHDKLTSGRPPTQVAFPSLWNHADMRQNQGCPERAAGTIEIENCREGPRRLS